LDAQSLQAVVQRVRADAPLAQRCDDLAQSARLRRGFGTLVFASAANSMHPFGYVDGMEIGRERTHERCGMGDLDGGEFARHVLDAGARCAPGNGRDTDTLDLVEEGLTLLFGKDLADQGTDPVDIVA